MQGRLENKIKNEKLIETILLDLPDTVSKYYYSRPNKESKGNLEYLRKIRGFLKYIDEDTRNIDINKITENDVSKYLHSIEITIDKNGNKKETSFAYRKQVYTILNSFFEYLRKKKMIKENPMDCIDRPDSVDLVERVKLNENDLRNIIQSVDLGAGTEEQKSRQQNWKERDKAILIMLMTTGMRETALTEINMEDIDFENNIVTVIDKRHKEHKYYIKNTAKQLLIEWINKREELLNGEKVEAVFLSNRKSRIDASSVALIVRKYSLEGIGKELSPHKLRAAFCTIMYEKSGDIEKVRDAVGHSDINTTKRYIVKDNKARLESADIMDSVFSSVN